MKFFWPLVIILVCVSMANVLATEYWPPDDPRWEAQAKSSEEEPLKFETQRDLAEYLLWRGMLAVQPGGKENFTGESYLETMNEAAAFIATMQVSDPDTITFGGMREGEHMLDVIQSDNTQESIWVWSRYRSLTGDTTYDANVEAAWQYIMNFPAYNEEGGTGDIGYYRVYNCGWGLWAVMGYEEAYGDTSYRSYGDSCAVYIMAYPLDIYKSLIPYNTLNGLVESWAVGSLYKYGLYVDDLAMRLTAADMGGEIKGWVEDNPSRGLARENWAMSGGATMWGVLNSFFQRRPDLLSDWLDIYEPYLKQFDDSGPWNTAHNLWYSLGHQTVWEASGSSSRKVNHRLLIEAMMGLDTDNDGGIPAQIDEPDTTDQSWVTNYLSFMGFDVLIPPGDVSATAEQYLVQAGGMLSTNVAIANNADSTVSYSGWIDVETPYGPYPGNPILGPIDFGIGSWDVLALPLNHFVPAIAPQGIYTYRVSLDFGGDVVDVSEFPFLVIPGNK
jgi:hypothetical protein